MTSFFRHFYAFLGLTYAFIFAMLALLSAYLGLIDKAFLNLGYGTIALAFCFGTSELIKRAFPARKEHSYD